MYIVGNLLYTIVGFLLSCNTLPSHYCHSSSQEKNNVKDKVTISSHTTIFHHCKSCLINSNE